MVDSARETVDAVAGHIVVVGVTRDHAEVWSLEPRQRQPLIEVLRDNMQNEHRHMRPAQNKHGHESDEGFTGYFERLAMALASASEVMIAGHGAGHASAMEEFAEYLQKFHPALFGKVSELRYVDIGHLSGRQLSGLARDWKKEQASRGFGKK